MSQVDESLPWHAHTHTHTFISSFYKESFKINTHVYLKQTWKVNSSSLNHMSTELGVQTHTHWDWMYKHTRAHTLTQLPWRNIHQLRLEYDTLSRFLAFLPVLLLLLWTHTHTHTHSYGLMFICLCFLCSLSLDNVLNCNHFNHSLISTLQMIFSTQNGVLCMFLKFTCLSAGEPRSYWGGICQFLRRVLAPVAHPDIWRQQTTFVIINSQQPHTLCPQFRYNWLSTLSEARGIGKVVSWENRAVQKSFAQRGARTHDPEIKSLMLYRLS